MVAKFSLILAFSQVWVLPPYHFFPIYHFHLFSSCLLSLRHSSSAQILIFTVPFETPVGPLHIGLFVEILHSRLTIALLQIGPPLRFSLLASLLGSSRLNFSALQLEHCMNGCRWATIGQISIGLSLPLATIVRQLCFGGSMIYISALLVERFFPVEPLPPRP